MDGAGYDFEGVLRSFDGLDFVSRTGQCGKYAEGQSKIDQRTGKGGGYHERDAGCPRRGPHLVDIPVERLGSAFEEGNKDECRRLSFGGTKIDMTARGSRCAQGLMPAPRP